MNHITDHERVVSDIPKLLKRSLVASLKRDGLSISQAIKRLIILYIDGEVMIHDGRRFYS